MRSLLAGGLLVLSAWGAWAASLVYVIPIHDEVDPSMAYLVRRGVREATANKADYLVLNMDTPGGRTDAMEQIVRAVEGFSHQDRTVTYVDKKAASAGAFIASATHSIYMAPGSVIGAATPVMLSSSHEVQALPESYERKITSFFEATGRATAERHGHDPAVFAAMVDRNAGLTVDGTVIVAKGNILTLTAAEAERPYGHPPRPLLSAGTVDSLDALVARVAGPGARVVTVEPTGFERLGRLLVLAAPFLMAAGVFLAYMEIKAQGTMIFGVLAAACFLLLFLGSYVAGLSGYEPLVLFVLGGALVAVEIFLFPGLVVPVALGLLLILVSLLLALGGVAPGGFLPSATGLGAPLLRLLGGFALGGLAIFSLARFVPRLPWAAPLERATVRGAGFGAPDAPSNLVRPGDLGETLTHLRPAGTARFGERRLDVVSDGAFVPPATLVRVVAVEGIRVVVRPA